MKFLCPLFLTSTIEGLARADKNKYPILTGGEAENTENLKREILKLRIENERLKKIILPNRIKMAR